MARNQAADQYRPMIQSAARAYGYDPGVLMQVARLESSFDPGAVNDWDSNARAGTPSKGMFQFIEPTFNAYARQAKAANPGAWRGVDVNWLNPQAQALAASWAMANGKGSAWATFDQAKRNAGGVQRQSASTAPTASAPATGGSLFDAKQTAALNMIFGDNPRMANLVRIAEQRAAQAGTARVAGTNTPAPAASSSISTDGGADTWKQILAFGEREFGLKIDGHNQTTGGKHAPGSFHYTGRAVDFGDAKNSPAKLRQMAAWARQNAPRIKEFYYDPLGWYIKNGKVVKGSIGGHGEHVHLAM